MQKSRIRAIALMSGGLDSTLAAKMVLDQGVEVKGLHLASPFGCVTDVKKNAEAIGVPLLIREKGEAYLDLVKNPRYGYGKNINPCVDCRIFMFQLAEAVLEEESAQFIVTGEVLGQRPMSQIRSSLNIIDRDSHMKGKILRPLSAHFFPPTEAETKGWVDRAKLLKISGRGRKDQMALALKFGIENFESPGGGCLLTETDFSRRLRDFFEHDDEGERLGRASLLRFGRHFRLSPKARAIIGRNQTENAFLEERWEKAEANFFKPTSFSGPSAVIIGETGQAETELVGRLLVRYGKGGLGGTIELRSRSRTHTFTVDSAIAEEQLEKMRI